MSTPHAAVHDVAGKRALSHPVSHSAFRFLVVEEQCRILEIFFHPIHESAIFDPHTPEPDLCIVVVKFSPLYNAIAVGVQCPVPQRKAIQ